MVECFRAAGKTEEKIADIIQEAAEKATANKSILQAEYSNTNNWRKMHGWFMTRKQKVRKKNERRKRADNH